MNPSEIPPGMNIGNQTIEQLEMNPRLVGLAESVLQQNAAILETNHMIISLLCRPVLVMKTEIFSGEENPQGE